MDKVIVERLISFLVRTYGWEVFLRAAVKNMRSVPVSIMELRGHVKDTLNQLEREQCVDTSE